MIFTFLTATISVIFFFGVLRLQRRKDQITEGKSAYQVYQSFFASFTAYFAILAFANVLPISPITAQVAFYLALYVFLFIGLGFCLLFTIRVSGRPALANIVFGVASGLGVTMFLYRMAHLPLPQLSSTSLFFFYRNPSYTGGEIFIISLGIVFTAGLFAVQFFRTSINATAAPVRRRSIFMALGAVVAAIDGVSYFASHLLSQTVVPYAATAGLVPAVVGFFLMTYPLLFRHKEEL
ncbi:MAG: hypothetical protein WC052_01600 [Patescibacteria group bacterium]|jgi:hypothetical protein